MRVHPFLAQHFWTFIGAIIQPTTIITFFGPLILHSNLKLLRGNLFINNYDTSLIAALQNRWTVAISEWEIQLYTFIIAFVILISHTILAWLILVKSGLSAHTKSRMAHDLLAILTVISLVISILAFFMIIIAGVSSTEDVVAMYLPPIDNIRGSEFDWPPIKSPITWGRLSILLSGLFLFSTIRKYQRRFPGVKNTSDTANSLLKIEPKK